MFMSVLLIYFDVKVLNIIKMLKIDLKNWKYLRIKGFLLYKPLFGTHSIELFQIQNGNSKTVVIERQLCILYHQNQVLLLFNGKIIPITSEQRIDHFGITVGGHFSKVTIEKNISAPNQKCY